MRSKKRALRNISMLVDYIIFWCGKRIIALLIDGT
jgi:hypothetical protein